MKRRPRCSMYQTSGPGFRRRPPRGRPGRRLGQVDGIDLIAADGQVMGIDQMRMAGAAAAFSGRGRKAPNAARPTVRRGIRSACAGGSRTSAGRR